MQIIEWQLTSREIWTSTSLGQATCYSSFIVYSLKAVGERDVLFNLDPQQNTVLTCRASAPNAGNFTKKLSLGFNLLKHFLAR